MIERHDKVFVPVSVVDAAKLDVDKIIKVYKGHKEGGYFPYGFAEEKENVYVLSEQELKEIRDALSYGEMEIKKLYKSSGYLNSNILQFIGNALDKLQSKTNPQTENK